MTNIKNNRGGRIKYPRTPHLPWSPGKSADDLNSPESPELLFGGKEVVVTEKMDGENTTMYPEWIHARSLDSAHHPSRTWVKGLHGQIKHLIPAGWRVCGENLYAKHSIEYDDLSSYFMVFSVWNAENVAVSWTETVEWAELLGLKHVPVLYQGMWNEQVIKNLYNPEVDFAKIEGYVVRVAKKIPYGDFKKSVAKFVRKGHVQTDQHWMTAPVVPNKLVQP